MNNWNQEIQYRLFKLLAGGDTLTQREMAKKMGISPSALLRLLAIVLLSLHCGVAGS